MPQPLSLSSGAHEPHDYRKPPPGAWAPQQKKPPLSEATSIQKPPLSEASASQQKDYPPLTRPTRGSLRAARRTQRS